MKKIFAIVALCAFAFNASAQNCGNHCGGAVKVKPGVEVLRESGFKVLDGKRVGLVTNPSGIDNDLKSTVDILNEAPNCKLVALYGPEHGVRGNAHAGDAVGDASDPKTGVKTYSLYGKTHKPTAEMLKDIDVLVYDIQDIGCRSYTFYATMGVCMEACAEFDKEFVVLDRPNPLGGNKVEGNLVEDGYFSFVSKYAIPYLYGLTPGELAQYLNGEGVISAKAGGKKCKLTVVPMEGWKRSMKFRETGMPWVAPSPQIPAPENAFFYPISGVIGELYIFNTGIGYTLPFETFATSWIDADKLCDKMNALNLPGLKFRPINYKPFYDLSWVVEKEKGQEVHGVQTYITDFDAANLTLTQFYFLQVVHEMYPDVTLFDQNPKRFAMFDKVCGTKEIRERFSKRYKVEDIADYFNKDNESFKAKSAKYYLYK